MCLLVTSGVLVPPLKTEARCQCHQCPHTLLPAGWKPEPRGPPLRESPWCCSPPVICSRQNFPCQGPSPYVPHQGLLGPHVGICPAQGSPLPSPPSPHRAAALHLEEAQGTMRGNTCPSPWPQPSLACGRHPPGPARAGAEAGRASTGPSPSHTSTGAAFPPLQDLAGLRVALTDHVGVGWPTHLDRIYVSARATEVWETLVWKPPPRAHMPSPPRPNSGHPPTAVLLPSSPDLSGH